MLDAIHETPDLNYGHSSIAYTCGEIGPHNIVLAVLPQYGNNDSGVIANQLKNDFPSVQNALLVGIAGGIPDINAGRDMRFGDVVVSDWKGDMPGVVQFDRGKYQVDGFMRTGSLNRPSNLLLTTVRNVQSRHSHENANILTLVNDMFRRFPGLSQRFSRPSTESDQLYNSSYEHTEGTHCERCDRSCVVERAARTDDQPQIHYGIFGSSNTVLRNGSERERLRSDIPGLLAVEMEAAGLINVLSCVVIKGICDYADSHKNKIWQAYAAATAAAYAKELLSHMPANASTGSNEYQLSRSMTLATMDSSLSSSQQISYSQESPRYEALSESLTFSRMDARLRNVKDALPRTCRWVRDLPQFQAWIKRLNVQQHKGFLWIKGKPGCGKSTIMKTTYAWAKKNWKDEIIISYFFNARAPGLLEKSSLGLYRSLTYQLLQAVPSTQHVFTEFFISKYRENEIEQWTKEELQNFWNILMQDLSGERLNIFIDALDEGNIYDVRQMISFLEDLTERAYENGCDLRICLSSRHYPEIRLRDCLSLVMENEVGHDRDIEAYVKAKLWVDSPEEAESFRQQICDMSSHVFLWVVLVIEILNGSTFRGNPEQRQRSLEQLPKDLDGLFEQIMARDDVDLGYTDIFLRWVLFSERPLNQAEIYVATKNTFSIMTGTDDHTAADRIPSSTRLDQFILDNSRGLAELTKSSPPVVQFIHETVRTFLLERGMKRLSTSPAANMEAQTHDLFAKTCISYIDAHSENIYEHNERKDSLEIRKAYMRELSRRVVFLEYAATHLFTHANSAQRLGSSQEQLLDTLHRDGSRKLAIWVKARNCFQKFFVRQYRTLPTLLYIFAEHNLPQLCTLRLSRLSGENINKVARIRYGTALQAACVGGHQEIAQILIHGGADVNVVGGEYEHALFAAMFHKNYQLMDWLVQKGARPSKISLESRLFKMITRGSLRAVTTLLELGASILCLNSRGELPLYHAIAKRSSKEMLSVLIDAGADLDFQCSYGTTALGTVCSDGNSELVRFLLDAGANVNLQSSPYGTPLAIASCWGHTEIVRLLLEAGAKINYHMEVHYTALTMASYYCRTELVRLLLDAGADINKPSEQLGTPLIAATHGGIEIVRLLLDAGADVNFQQIHHGSALYEACGLGDIKVVRLLLDAGADVNLQGGVYTTALRNAAAHDHSEIVRLLLSHGANAELGETPSENDVEEAKRKSDVAMQKILLGFKP